MNVTKLFSVLAFCMLALQGCSNAFSPSVTGTASGKTVALQGSQQGQSCGMIDFDGDGIDDMVVGAPFATSTASVGALIIFRGSSNGFAASPTWVLTGDDNFGFSFADLGDMDGDNNADFAVGAYNGNGNDVSLSGSVTVFKGGSNGRVIAKLAGDAPFDKFGLTIAAGDFNGDGKREIVVGAPFRSPTPALYQRGAVYIFPPPYDDATRIILSASATHGGLGNSVAVGEVNGDGIDDLLVGATGKVLVFYGKPGFNPSSDPPDVVITSADGSFGTAIAVLDDLNGDGFREIAIGAAKATVNGNAEQGRLSIVTGGTGTRTINLNSSNPDLLTRINGAAYFERFGSTVTQVGAIPGDNGMPNIAVTALHADKDGATSLATGLVSGKIYLVQGKDLTRGGDTPLTKATVFNGPTANMHYGSIVYPFSKNGPKLLIGAPTDQRGTGAVYAVSLENGSSTTPIFSATGTGNSTTGESCCKPFMTAKGGIRP